MGTLVPYIYNIRISQYSATFTERLRMVVEKRAGFLDPVVTLFVKHFVGKNLENSVRINISLSIVLIPYEGVIHGIVRNYL